MVSETLSFLSPAIKEENKNSSSSLVEYQDEVRDSHLVARMDEMGVTHGPESHGEPNGSPIPISSLSLSLSLLIIIASSPRLCLTHKVKLDVSRGTHYNQTRCRSSGELPMHFPY